MKIKANPGALFTLFLLLVFAGGAYAAREWPYQARLFPWAVGVPVLLLCVAQLGLDLFRAEKEAASGDTNALLDLPVDRGIPVSVVKRRAMSTFGWISGFALLLWTIGFIIAIPLFVFSYLMIQAREKWSLALVYTGALLIFVLGLFHYVLHMSWPAGVVSGPQELILGWIGH